MAKKLFDRTIGTPADTDYMVFGTSSTLAKMISWSNLKTLLLGSTWTSATLNAGYANVGGDPVKYRTNKAGQLEIKGSFTVASTPATPIVFTFPYTEAPGTTRYFMISGLYGSTRSLYYGKVTNSGEVTTHNDAAWSPYDTFSFNVIITI